MKKTLLTVVISCAFSVFGQVPNYVPSNGLLAYWPFSGNTNDQTANANHLTNNGATLVADRNGTANAAYSFNGAGNYLEKTVPSFVFSPSGTFSISFWINRPSTTGGVAMMSGSGTANNFIWLFSGGAANNVFGTNKQQSAWIWANSPYSLNQWEHYVCMYINGVMRVYRNGVLEVSATYTHTGALSTALPFYIGKDIGTSYFNGSIDDIAIWNRSLTNCEIQKMYTSQLPNIVSNAGPDFTVCKGDTITLSGTGTGANTYNWNMGITNNNPFVINTTTTYTYSAVGQFNCVVTDQVVVTVNQPQVNAGANQTVCAGTAVTLSGTGSTALLWNNNVINGSPFTPDSTQTYTVSGTDANGCYGTDQVVVSVNTPLISAGSDVTICSGDTVTLIATGLQTPAWNNNVVNGVGFVPTTSASFEVSGTDVNGCAGTDQVLVTVNQTANTVLNEVTLGSYTLNGTTYAQSGTYTQTLTSQNGCDSIITLNLSISGVGISENEHQFVVYPNPAAAIITIQGNGEEQTIRITDALGRTILEQISFTKDTIISIEKLEPGNYFIELLEEKVHISFIKQ
ncbi:MAG: hypothetical protein RLZZ569_1054 [Bacteroidota bacterium]